MNEKTSLVGIGVFVSNIKRRRRRGVVVMIGSLWTKRGKEMDCSMIQQSMGMLYKVHITVATSIQIIMQLHDMFKNYAS